MCLHHRVPVWRIRVQWFDSGFKMLKGFASWVPFEWLLTMASPLCFGPILVTVLTFLTGILTKTYFHSLLLPNRYSFGCFTSSEAVPLNILFAQLSLLKANPSAVNGTIILTSPHEHTHSSPEQLFQPRKLTHFLPNILATSPPMNISTLSSRYQICSRVLSAALTATESWREADE